MGAVPTCASTQ